MLISDLILYYKTKKYLKKSVNLINWPLPDTLSPNLTVAIKLTLNQKIDIFLLKNEEKSTNKNYHLPDY